MKKKRIDVGLRNSTNAFINEKDLEENIKSEINREINQTKRK